MNSFQPEQQLIQIFIVNNDDLKKAIEKKKTPRTDQPRDQKGRRLPLRHYIITLHYNRIPLLWSVYYDIIVEFAKIQPRRLYSMSL